VVKVLLHRFLFGVPFYLLGFLCFTQWRLVGIFLKFDFGDSILPLVYPLKEINFIVKIWLNLGDIVVDAVLLLVPYSYAFSAEVFADPVTLFVPFYNVCKNC